jgi:signal peptidase I
VNILKNALLISLLLISIAFLAFRLAGGTVLAITGASMEPTIHKGSIVLVQASSPSDIQVGDVITFVFYGQTTTHRVIAIDETPEGLAFTTKGDANVAADPEAKLFHAQVGIALATIPLLGYALVYAQAYAWIALAAAGAAVFLISFVQVARALRSQHAQPRRSRA